MGILLVTGQKVAADTDGTVSTTISAPALPANTTTGNLIVVQTGHDNSGATTSSISDGSATTYTRDVVSSFHTGANQGLKGHYAKNITGGTTPTLTATFSTGAAFRHIHVSEFSGADTVSPLDKTAAATGDPNGSTYTSGSATPTSNGQLIYGGNGNGSGTLAAGSGFTALNVNWVGNHYGNASEYQIQSVAASIAATFTGNVDNYATIMMTFKAAGGVAATPPTQRNQPLMIGRERVLQKGGGRTEGYSSIRGQPFAALLPVDNTPQPTGAQNVPPLPPQPKVMMLEPWRRGPFTGPQPARIGTPAASGDVTGTVSATDENDTSAASGIVTVTGSIAASEANDTPSASGAVTVTGTVAATEANDTPSITGTVTVTGTIAATEANDNSSASGTVATPTGTVTVTEGDDSATASGTITLTGSVAATEADDTSSAFGTVPSATAPHQEQPAWPYELKLPTLSGRKSWLNS